MTLTANNVGNNPQQPVGYAETYIPDQLIAGNMKIVTDIVMVTGSAPVQRGSILGVTTATSLSTSAGTAYASGSITLAGNPIAGDTITLAGTTITFVATNPYGNQVLIGATAAASAQNLEAFLASSADSNLSKFTYSVNGSAITTTSAATGTAGNALTLATSDATNITLSGSTLSGGAANTGNATIGGVAPGAAYKSGNYKVVCATATTATVFDPNGDELGVAAFGTPFNNAQVTFTITAGGTPCAAGDTFVLSPVGAGLYKLATATATDGSQNPVAILADYSDPTSGNVAAPIYLQGEFNMNAAIYGPGITPSAAKNALHFFDIYLKSVVTAVDPT